jgi:hypothetical protein
VDHVEERRQPVHRVLLARQRRRKVEAEAVHVHLLHPVAQRVVDQLDDLRVARVQRVARPRVVHVEAGIVLHQAVVGRVVDPLERERGAQVVPLGGVVVHHVQDHLDAGRVQPPHHLLELAHLAAAVAAPGVARVRRKKLSVL